jgi:hypothetical protein
MTVEDNRNVRRIQVERDPFGLADLPPLDPPTDDWPAIEAALRAHRNKRRSWQFTAASLAMAATLILALGLTLRPPWPSAEAPGAPAAAPPAEAAVSANGSEQAVDSLIAMSQRLEDQLRRIRNEAPLSSASAVLYQVELEDLVAQVDDELTANPDSAELWGQRVGLLLDLTRLYRNELRRESARMASL